MLIIVGLSLASVLIIVIPMGTLNQDHNWLFISIKAIALLASASLLLYFWIVVLELFLKMGPILIFDPPPGMPVNYPLMYPQNAQIYGPAQGYQPSLPPPTGPAPPIPQQQMYAHYGRERPL